MAEAIARRNETASLAGAPAETKHSQIAAAEIWASSVLRYGVLISLALTACGVVLLLVQGQTGYHDFADLSRLLAYDGGAVVWPHSIGSVISGALALRPYALILLGLLCLIATPVLRVVVSIFAFAAERDRTYVAITLFVLAVLFLSFALGAVEGH